MNLLANLSVTYRRSLAGGSFGSGEAGQNSERRISPYAEMVEILERLKQSDPTLYQRVKQEAFGCLQSAARTADAAVDIRRLVARQRCAWLRSLARRCRMLLSIPEGMASDRRSVRAAFPRS